MISFYMVIFIQIGRDTHIITSFDIPTWDYVKVILINIVLYWDIPNKNTIQRLPYNVKFTFFDILTWNKAKLI